ncbi:lipocalin family protein [Olleya sp. Bg11-27]|uniref:lipocalin family protein n=1 Tax=Olleya sp. Bg11-27 TaxID=2058135 RepID=UPI000C3078DD|nr:lipocalin family protein [Olleya sp. Bg11-27]AUC75706.1 hypothetical protein CW732_08480 [Olleya sp. Bg11-27]
MKTITLLLIAALTLVSCDNDDDSNTPTSETTIIGTWQLTHVYMDPGDGSGDFTSVTSSKTLTFDADGTVSSNTDMCTVASQTTSPTTGTYTTDGEINVDQCQNITLDFQLEQNTLIVYFPCIEACVEKYERL